MRRFSGRKTSRETQRERVEVARRMRARGPRQELEEDFTMEELRRSLRAMKSGKAPGPDGLRPEHLKSRGSLREIYMATQRSLAEYASPAWVPWVSSSGVEKLETAQRRAARRIAGTTMSTPGEAVLREAGLEELRSRYRKEVVCKYESWLHQEEGDIRREAVEREVRRRTKKQDWRENSRTLYENIMGGLA